MIVFIEGNIGSGKSTFLNLCLQNKALFSEMFEDVIVLQENVSDWMDENGTHGTHGKSLLDMFYNDKQKYAFPFQSYVLLSRVTSMIDMAVKRDNEKTLILCERSIMTDLEIFAKGLMTSGDMSEHELFVYEKWHALVQKVAGAIGVSTIGDSNNTIYLRTSPTVSFARIGHRGRKGEEHITQEYIDELHKRHDTWLMDSTTTHPLVIDATPNFVDDNLAFRAAVDRIIDFISVSSKKCRTAAAPETSVRARVS